MQMNGGFFGSMLPAGATSFMPQGPNNPMMISGVGSTPQGFTSPGMDPKLLAALAAFGKQQFGDGGMNSGGLPPNSFSPWMQNGGQAAPANGAPPAPGGGAAPGAGAPGGGMMDMIGKMSPDQIKAILGRLGIGGQSGAMASI